MEPVAQKMKQEFERVFGDARDVFTVRAPGRVNLIGEHTDYNDGYVMPMGLEQAVYITGRAASGSQMQFYSMNFDEKAELSVDGTEPAEGWALYVQAVARVLAERTAGAPGVQAVVWGDVPLGSGLSSSAALEVAVGFFLLHCRGVEMPLPELARACQEAENKYVGVQCGIMDQFASCLAGSDAALFLDCRSLEYEHVPVALQDHRLLILNTCMPRTLAGSAYNDRRNACERGLELLQRNLPGITALRDVTVEQFNSLENDLPADIAAKCRHVVTENERVLQSVDCLKQGDLAVFGELMNASHVSLRHDYNVSCRELDFLHDTAVAMPGVLGVRMTGAGFGGCAVALVRSDAAEEVRAQLAGAYQRDIGIALETYITTARQGVGLLES